MPEVGEYWYDAHGGGEVVRIVEVNDDVCTLLVVNTIVRPPTSGGGERLIQMELRDFVAEYQEEPDVAPVWFEAGSTWFDRYDGSTRVVIEGHDAASETVTFRTLRARGVGSLEFRSQREFATRYVRLPEHAEEGLTEERFWVTGGGLCAVFVARADAQAFIYEVSTLTNQSESLFQLSNIPHPAGWTQMLPHSGWGGAMGTAAAPPKTPEAQTLWERLTTPDE